MVPAFAASSGYSDVDEDAWYAEAVAYCRENNIMSGVGGGRFDPEGSLTRAALAALPYRIAGTPSLTGTDKFTDTNDGEWYSNAVLWASQQGLVSGYGNGLFGTNDPVTRQDMATILWRYAGSPTAESTRDFDDESAISAYAAAAVDWASVNGIVPAVSNGVFAPRSNATRAQIAVALMNYTRSANLDTTLDYDGVFPEHEPYGTGVGAMPGRVVWAHNPDSVSWDGGGYWWETDHFDEALILQMVNESIASLGGKDNAKDGWTALFTAHNGGNGYRAGEKIAIKANMNGSAVFSNDTSGETNMGYSNSVLLKTLLTSLVEEAGVSPECITVYDVSRLFPDYMVELCTKGNLQGVHFVGRDNAMADEGPPINWSYQFSGNVNYLPTCVTEANYVINFANLKGHSYGITLCGKNHFGSFINGNTMYPPQGANLHQWLSRNDMGIYSSLVDLMGNYQIREKTVLYMLDALICAPSEGTSITRRNSTWQQAPFNGDYTSSIFVSQDPVAIDSVGADFLINEPTLQENNGVLRNNPNVENYLHEAGLVSNAPSGTVYYDGNGKQLVNLGVHEHWNNSTLKQYSRNLGKEEGIELVHLSLAG